MHLTVEGHRADLVRCIRPLEVIPTQLPGDLLTAIIDLKKRIHFNFLGKVPLICENKVSFKMC